MEVSYKEKESTVGKIKHISGLDLDKGAPVQGPQIYHMMWRKG